MSLTKEKRKKKERKTKPQYLWCRCLKSYWKHKSSAKYNHKKLITHVQPFAALGYGIVTQSSEHYKPAKSCCYSTAFTKTKELVNNGKKRA